MEFEQAVETIAKKFEMENKEAEIIVNKAHEGGEINSQLPIEQWLEKRFFPNCVLIDENGYSRMCIDALKILSSTAATDYGSSRQRDMGQLWADMTRGYLGELSFKLFLENKCGIKSNLGHEKGTLEDYLPMDIHQVQEKGGEYRTPKINVSVKTTKWNGIWMDIPGDQFNHSDIHVFVKIGGGRDHLFAFFKSLSVFKDKVLKRGQEVGSLSSAESEALFNSLPSFKPIPAYICGFASSSDKFNKLSYVGKLGKKHYNIHSWNGPIQSGDLELLKKKEKVPGQVKFSAIGEFSHDSGYLFNSGNLHWTDEDWQAVCNRL
jgi:hypothetical protein